MIRVLSTECTYHLPAGCHPSITEHTTLTAGHPVDLTNEQAAYALTLPGVMAQGASSEPEPEPQELHISDIPAAEPPAPEED
ncbi:MAG: hypothetical protein JSS67_03620 [Bacteroidetes bacterium]|nr:hypothetical protein [Bacteroidota bacterium]